MSDCPVEQFYQSLLASVENERTRAGLKVIHEVCTQERTRPNPVLTVSHIGRLSAQQGGPSAKTVGNARHYAALVQRHAEAARRPKANPGDKDWLNAFGTPEQRAYVGSLINENRRLLVQLRATKHLADKTAIVMLDEPAKAAKPSPPIDTLSDHERQVLAEGLSAERLAEHFGWKEDEQGRVVNRAGIAMLPVGFMTALRKVVKGSN